MIKERVNEIDFLRFFAAISVVFFHYAFRGAAADGLSPLAFPALAHIAKYGYLGVELFFMISGFVILMTASSGSLRGFVVSRMVRLYPAFWACCAVTFFVTIAVDLPQFHVSLRQFLINLTMVNEFIGVPSIDSAYWSLFVELKFYALVAIVLVLGRIHQIELWLGLWLSCSVLNQFIHNGKLEYFLITNYSAFFIAGASCFLIWSGGVTIRRLAVLFLSWALSIQQAWSALPGFARHYQVALNEVIVASVVTIFFAIMLLISLRKTAAFGQKRWILAGVVTYPLYLLHQNLGYFAFNLGDGLLNSYLLLCGTTIVMIGAAYLVHRLMEDRFAQAFKRTINSVLDRLVAMFQIRPV